MPNVWGDNVTATKLGVGRSFGERQVGVPVAFVLMRILASLLVGVIRLDIPILVGLTVLLALAAALAGYLPARRAAKIAPIAALRNE